MKLIVLDRDGVINYDRADYIRCPDEWQPIASSLVALRKLHEAGFTVVVCTNQSGIGRGYYTQETLNLIHQKMQQVTTQAGGKITRIYACPHQPSDNCDCRKPKVGLLQQIARDFEVKLTGLPMVGDKCSDAKAALAMQMQPILVRTGLKPIYLSADPDRVRVSIYDDLLCATSALIGVKR